MKWTLALIAAFIFQEPASSGAVMLEAYKHHYSVWMIHVLYILITFFDIIIGYSLGNLGKTTIVKSKFFVMIQKKMLLFSESSSKYGKRIALVVLGPVIFPISAVLAPFLDVSLAEAVIFFMIGNIVFWYALEWLIVLGVASFIPNPSLALYAVAGIFIVIGILTRKSKRMRKKQL